MFVSHLIYYFETDLLDIYIEIGPWKETKKKKTKKKNWKEDDIYMWDN